MPTKLKSNQNKFDRFITANISQIIEHVYKNNQGFKVPDTDISKKIESYIKSARFEKNNFSINYLYYDVIYLHIAKILESYNIQVTFITTYSLNRKNETIEMDGQRFIIYDQYLGKTLNLFNKAFLQLKDPKILDYYCIRYLIEAFRVKGMAAEATIFADFGIKGNFLEKLNKAFSTPSEISAYTFIQETFIILHEIAHIIIKRNTKYITFKKNKIEEFIDKQPYSLLSRYETINKEIGSFELDDSRRKNLVEEMVCDYIATKHTFELLFELKLLNAQEFSNAIYLCLRSMRSINLTDGFITAYTKRDNEKTTHNLSQLFRESSIRFWHIRSCIGSMYKSKYKKYFKSDPVLEFLRKDFKDVYDSYFENPFLKVQKILEKIGKIINENPSLSDSTFQEQLEELNEIDRILGWT